MKPFPEGDFKSLFQTVPGLFLVLSPDLTIAEMSTAFPEATHTERNALLGKGLLDFIPSSENDNNNGDDVTMLHSVNYVLQQLKPHKTAVQKYAFTGTAGERIERYWAAENKPVFNEKKELVYILHSILDAGTNWPGTTTGYAGVDFDITEKKMLEQQITHLASIVEESSDAIFSRGNDLRMISWNKGAEKMFGYTKEEALGKKAAELGILRITDQEIWEIQEQIEQKGTWHSEKDFFHRDGSSFYGSITANAVRNEKQEISAVFLVIKDISLHRQLAQQLQKSNEELEEKVQARTAEVMKSESRFRALIENSNDIITLMDSSFKLLYRSPAATRILGWTDAEMIGVDATKNIYGEDKAYAAAIVKEVMNNPGKIVSTRFRMLHKKGHYLWLEGTLANYLLDKDIQAIVFNFRNIDERMRAEEKIVASEKQFRAALDNMLEGVQIHDFSWRYIYVNDALLHYTGKSRAQLEGRTLLSVYPGIMQTELFRTLDHCMQNRMARRFETEFISPEGRKSELMLSVQPHPLGLLILSVDVTKARAAERALKEEQDKFARVMAASPGLIYSFRLAPDGSFSFPFASSVFEEIFGVPYERAVENINLIMDAYLEEDKEKVFSSIAASAREMKAWHLQFRYNHPAKGVVWLEGNSIPTAAADGSVLWHGVITDVTERKMAEDKINEQNQRLKTLSDNLPEIMLFQLSGETFEKRKFTYVSNAATGLTGKSPEEILNDPDILYGRLEKEDLPRILAAELESFNNLTPFNEEVRFRDHKGRLHWLNLISTPRKSNNGHWVWDGFHIDITEKKLAEQQREFDNNNLKALINNTHDLMWSVDRDYNLITSNGAFDSVFEKLTGKKIEKGNSTLIRELGNKEAEKYKAHYERAFTGETFSVTEHDVSGEDFWSELSFYPIYDGKAIVGTACFSRNITDKKMAEQALQKSFDEKQAMAERLSIILNTLPANIALLDATGVIIDINDAWRRFADENGFSGGEYCLGENYIEISGNAFGKGKKDGKAVAKGIMGVLSGERNEFIFEYPCHSPSEERWFRMLVTPLQHQHYGGAVVMHIDISELRRLEQQRLKAKTEEHKKIAKAMLMGQEKERNYIGQELHDNVNQILAGTKLYLGLAGEKNRDVGEMIRYPMELLDSSMKEIRQLCHKMVTPFEHLALDELIRDLLLKLDVSTDIQTAFTYDMAPELLSDELKVNIYRIIQELVNNILKYAMAKNVAVSVTCGKSCIAVNVTDDGNGFDPRKKRKGIGISNIINRVKSFNGEIEIKSAPGKGCSTAIKFQR